MKNIHLLPLPQLKESRLFLNKNDNTLFLNEQYDESSPKIIGQNIYITSDKTPKAGNYWIDKKNVVQKTNFDLEYSQEIILTTDQDLIINGVQAIDDDFLEWFVKNPSCEFAEVQDWYSIYLSCCRSKEDCYCNRHRLIIPKEEHKQIKCYCGHTIYCDCDPLEESKQETLADSVKSNYDNKT